MNNQKQVSCPNTHINVMELLVAEEVDRQMAELPERLLKYLKRSEVETFALNRLPSLYASSEQGLHHQRQKGQQALKPQIAAAVRQAFAAVQSDPIRMSQPLAINAADDNAGAVLGVLKQWMQDPDLTWDTALHNLQKLQQRRQGKPLTARPAAKAPAAASDPQEAYAADGSELQSTALRPGVYGCREAWIPPHRRSQAWDRTRTRTPQRDR
ncbi:MAG: late competence development ComFB family protein [Cyanobacteria bacterium P01_D01_bin.115]